jgi:hypothetical protein
MRARLHLEAALCYGGFDGFQSPEVGARVVTRSLLSRCLVLLLSLALASGNAHAALHLDIAHRAPCPEEHAHHHGKTEPQHQHRHDKGLACCCDCLGCTASAYLAPALSITPIYVPARIHYDALNAFLLGQVVRPDPDPPRPGTLS